MPSIPKRGKQEKQPERMPLEEFYKRLQSLVHATSGLQRQITELQAVVCARGFDNAGPLNRSESDVPF